MTDIPKGLTPQRCNFCGQPWWRVKILASGTCELCVANPKRK